MQYVDRGREPPPPCLIDERSEDGRRILREIFIENYATISDSRIDMSRALVQGGDLDRPLARLFRGRCAFCEMETDVRAYRFRPSEEAGPTTSVPARDADRSHLYYTWLANAWRNLYPICASCWPREESIFPVRGRRCSLPDRDQVSTYTNNKVGDWAWPVTESPVLLDPCAIKDFRRHLTVNPLGELTGLSEKGVFTIQHFSLNRPQLVTSRAHAYARYLQRISEDPSEESVLELFNFEELEFGGTWYLLMRELALMMGDVGPARRLAPHSIWAYFRDRIPQREFLNRLRDAFQRFEALRAAPNGFSLDRRSDARPVHFIIENYKALEHVELSLKARNEGDYASEDPGGAPALIILGENAAGKSSVLEAMALVMADEGTRRGLGLVPSALRLNPKWMGAEGASGPRPGRIRVRYEDDYEGLMQIEQGLPGRGPGEARIPVFAYGAFRMFLKGGKEAASSSIRSLFMPDYVLPNPEAWLVSIDGTALFKEVIRNLKFILAVEQKVDLLEVDRAKGECFLVISPETSGDRVTVRYPLSSVSSGFRSVLAMACDIMRRLSTNQGRFEASMARSRAVVLIDEVEAHLHPKWKMRIIHGLREALPQVTFVLTTHDPLCLRGVAAEEVKVFRRLHREQVEGAELPSYVEQLQEMPAIGALTIEQLLTSDLFQLHSTDSPDLEAELAKAGDMLAREQALRASDSTPSAVDSDALKQVRASLRAQIGKALPVGSTEVERLVQDAVEDYLVQRRNKPHEVLLRLRDETRNRIVAALGSLG